MYDRFRYGISQKNYNYLTYCQNNYKKSLCFIFTLRDNK